MHPLSEKARFIVDRMEPDRPYQPSDLRALAPGASVESLREVMHELWVNRQVERVGYAGWQRHRSAPPLHAATSKSPAKQTKHVKPEDLFDHSTFAGFFK